MNWTKQIVDKQENYSTSAIGSGSEIEIEKVCYIKVIFANKFYYSDSKQFLFLKQNAGALAIYVRIRCTSKVLDTAKGFSLFHTGSSHRVLTDGAEHIVGSSNASSFLLSSFQEIWTRNQKAYNQLVYKDSVTVPNFYKNCL